VHAAQPIGPCTRCTASVIGIRTTLAPPYTQDLWVIIPGVEFLSHVGIESSFPETHICDSLAFNASIDFNFSKMEFGILTSKSKSSSLFPSCIFRFSVSRFKTIVFLFILGLLLEFPVLSFVVFIENCICNSIDKVQSTIVSNNWSSLVSYSIVYWVSYSVEWYSEVFCHQSTI